MQPKVSYDGTKMVYVANYFGSLKPYVSEIQADSNKWGRPEPLFPAEITDRYEVRYPQLNTDHSRVYFSATTQEKADYDIYYSDREGDGWSEPALVPMDINTDLDEVAPAVSANGKKILYSRSFPVEDKADEFCYQLWVSEMTETGAWSEASPLPPAYNTGCTCAPYWGKDNKTFFYSSYEPVSDEEGKRLSRNQFNIFWAKLDGLFDYTPKPILELIGENDLLSFSIDMDSTIYVGSGEHSRGQDRIESSILSRSLSRSFQPEKMSLLSGRVVDKTNQPLAAFIQVIDPFTTKVFQEVSSDNSGYYQVIIPEGSQFSVRAVKEGYSAQSKLMDDQGTVDFELFPEVNVTFNVFDQDFYFPIQANVVLYDSSFNLIQEISNATDAPTQISLGRELNIILQSDNYAPDTLNLPFDKDVIFDSFDFDIELIRKLKEVTMNFTDEEGNNLGLEITVFNVSRNEKTKRQVKDGQVSLQLRDGEVYEISTSAQGYSYYSTELDLSKDDVQEEVKASLQSIENISLVLNNITFEVNSYSLNAGSYDELNNLVSYLQDNPQYRVEISAHTDNAGSDDYNLKLSNLRANSVLQYIQDNSINKDRMVAVGYGESRPIYPNDTEENMARNRRVEFKVLASE